MNIRYPLYEGVYRILTKHEEYAAAFREDQENKESPERRETRQRSREVEETSPNRIIHKQQIIT